MKKVILLPLAGFLLALSSAIFVVTFTPHIFGFISVMTSCAVSACIIYDNNKSKNNKLFQEESEMADMKLTPTGQYNPDVRYTDDPELEKLLEKPIGKYGSLWQEWIKLTYPNMVVLYVTSCTWAIIPRQIDQRADERYDELDEIYRRDNPRPDTADFNVLRQWEEEREFWIEHILIDELVNVKYPTEL